MSQQPEIGSYFQTPDLPEPQLKSVALVQLIAIVTLALSTLIAATAVTVGLGHAHVATTMSGPPAAPFAMTASPIDRAA
jgi:hypothetical protein